MKFGRQLALGLWAAVMAAALWYVAARLTVVNDMSLFLPQEQQTEGRLLVETLRRGSAARVMLLALEGGDEARLAAGSAALALRLRASGLFEQVANGGVSALDAERERWFRYRYLLAPMPADTFEAAVLRRQLQARLAELASPWGMLDKASLPADPLAAFRSLLRQWQPPRTPALRHGVWFSADGRQALLLAQTRAGGLDLDRQQEALAQLDAALAQEPALQGLHLQASSPGVIGVATRDAIRSESQWLSAVATAALLLILWWGYRSWRLLWLSALPLLTALTLGVALVGLVFGTVHAIVLAFGITLLGVALDYPLHLFSHLEPGQPPRQAVQRIWPTLRLGLLTSLIGYLAMLTSRFTGLVQLAVLALGGLIAAAVTVRWVLPALLPAAGIPLPPAPTVAAAAPRRARLRWLLALCALAALYLAGSPRPLWESELAALSPVPESLRQREAQLRQALGSADFGQVLVLHGNDAEAVLQRCEALRGALTDLRAGDALHGYELPCDLLPSVALQRARQALLPPAERLRQQLAQAQHGLPFRAELFQPFVADVTAARALAPLTPRDIADSALGARLDSVLFAVPGEWLGLVQLHGITAPQQIAQWAARQGPGVDYLAVKATTDRMMEEFRRDALRYLLAGAALILVVLRLSLGERTRLGAVLLPVATAMLVTTALLHLLAVPLSLFHLVALLLVLGLGIDYGLFFNRGEPAAARERTAHALLLCAVSTITVFGILALSHIPVLRAVGITVALGALLSYLLARWVRSDALPAGPSGASAS